MEHQRDDNEDIQFNRTLIRSCEMKQSVFTLSLQGNSMQTETTT